MSDYEERLAVEKTHEELVAWIADFNPWQQNDAAETIRCFFCAKTEGFASVSALLTVEALTDERRADFAAGLQGHEPHCAWLRCYQSSKRPAPPRSGEDAGMHEWAMDRERELLACLAERDRSLELIADGDGARSGCPYTIPRDQMIDIARRALEKEKAVNDEQKIIDHEIGLCKTNPCPVLSHARVQGEQNHTASSFPPLPCGHDPRRVRWWCEECSSIPQGSSPLPPTSPPNVNEAPPTAGWAYDLNEFNGSLKCTVPEEGKDAFFPYGPAHCSNDAYFNHEGQEHICIQHAIERLLNAVKP